MTSQRWQVSGFLRWFFIYIFLLHLYNFFYIFRVQRSHCSVAVCIFCLFADFILIARFVSSTKYMYFFYIFLVSLNFWPTLLLLSWSQKLKTGIFTFVFVDFEKKKSKNQFLAAACRLCVCLFQQSFSLLQCLGSSKNAVKYIYFWQFIASLKDFYALRLKQGFVLFAFRACV